MNKSLTKLVNNALPATSNRAVTYNKERNMYVTTGYTSQMGHTYFQGIQLNDRVAVVFDIGQGGWGFNPLFLNGVTVYCFDGQEKKIIGRWTPYDWEFYSDRLAKSVAIELLFDYLRSQTLMIGASVSDDELREYAKAQIEEATKERPLLTA